jgi:hypothetical protein
MKANEFAAKYQEIWDKYSTSNINKPTKVENSNLLDRGFEFQFDDDISNPDVLFVGINPSYDERDPIIKGTYTKTPNVPGYFRPFYKVEQDLKGMFKRDITWTHIDLLAIRESQQAYVENNLNKKRQGMEFIIEQLAVTKEIIEHFNPKVIVVPNLLGRELMSRNKKTLADDRVVGDWMDCEFEFDNDLGTDKIIDAGSLNGVPVFFTGMMTGQRALDRGTFQRLVWHIDNLLAKIK